MLTPATAAGRMALTEAIVSHLARVLTCRILTSCSPRLLYSIRNVENLRSGGPLLAPQVEDGAYRPCMKPCPLEAAVSSHGRGGEEASDMIGENETDEEAEGSGEVGSADKDVDVSADGDEEGAASKDAVMGDIPHGLEPLQPAKRLVLGGKIRKADAAAKAAVEAFHEAVGGGDEAATAKEAAAAVVGALQQAARGVLVGEGKAFLTATSAFVHLAFVMRRAGAPLGAAKRPPRGPPPYPRKKHRGKAAKKELLPWREGAARAAEEPLPLHAALLPELPKLAALLEDGAVALTQYSGCKLYRTARGKRGDGAQQIQIRPRVKVALRAPAAIAADGDGPAERVVMYEFRSATSGLRSLFP